MKRIGVFVFYDSDGHVDEYIEVLLSSMRTVLQKLIIVVNGRVKPSGYVKLKRYSDSIIIRENFGFDAGAYREIFTKNLSSDMLQGWDEVVLFNDTFYGPFYSWNTVWGKMENEQADFWGISRHPKGGRKLTNGKSMPSHIQGYFLVCRKSLFLSRDWMEFWDTMEYPQTYQEAIEKYEIRFSEYFLKKGYGGKAFTDKSCIPVAYGENPCMCYFRPLIETEGFPILKKKVMQLEYLDGVKNVLNYLDKNTDYKTELIVSNIERLCRGGKISPLEPFEGIRLERFYHCHKQIYIYGHGAYGKGIAGYFTYRGWTYKGFLVTEKREKDDRVSAYRDVKIENGDGVVLALGKEFFYEVYSEVRKDLTEEQLCYPEYKKL